MSNQPSPTGDDGELTREKFCVQCGTVNALRANYCSNCGARFEAELTPPPAVAHTINELPHIDLSDAPQPEPSMRVLSRYMEEVDTRQREVEENRRRLIESVPFAVGTLFRPISRAIGSRPTMGLLLLVGGFLCYGLAQLPVPRPPFSPSAWTPTHWSASPTPAPSATNLPPAGSTWLAFEETLHGEGDLSCIAGLSKDQPLVAANFFAPSGSLGVALITADGKQFCWLTHPARTQLEAGRNDAVQDFAPRWLSKDQLEFNSDRISEFSRWGYDAFVAKTDGTHLQHVNLKISDGHEVTDSVFYQPIWSPDGKSIAYSTTFEASVGALNVVKADGTGLRQLTNGMPVGWIVWSPDSQWLYFDVNRQIYKVAANGKGLRSLGINVDYFPHFAVSPDGGYIALISVNMEQNEVVQLSVFSTDGASQKIILPKAEDSLSLCQVAPAWLNGNTILFTAATGNDGCKIYEIGMDGSGFAQFYTGPESVGSLAVYMPPTKES